ncbi:MAG TPA: PQQ-dependent sugar dehydrogenase [Candidatus Deferrimicrobiaceae bacterium]|nr:PQQ-dependent sugar dehydrogenase [Candidatus Deferrimicrobiaceae bacterium]
MTVRAEGVVRIDGRPLGFAPLRDGRLFVASQDGRAWVVDPAGPSVRQEPLVDLRDRVLSGGERGLLGIAVHPRFPDDRRVFVHYTDRDGNTVVSSLEANAGGTLLDPSSERVILRVDQPYNNHNGGAVLFGPDGYLYVSLGDGGSGGDPHGNGQSLDALLGKILRLDVDAGGDAYAIPAGNPWAGGGGRPEVWHYGLRNPWRLSFDRVTGDLWIGDVGQGAWEEVDVARAGASGLNFGWNFLEGRHCYRADGCDREGLVEPVTEYDHSLGCTVIGGFVYRGAANPALRGGYLFGDYCSGRIWAIAAAGDGFRDPVEVGRAGDGLAAFGEDVAGELYLANLDGTISRVTARER